MIQGIDHVAKTAVDLDSAWAMRAAKAVTAIEGPVSDGACHAWSRQWPLVAREWV